MLTTKKSSRPRFALFNELSVLRLHVPAYFWTYRYQTCRHKDLSGIRHREVACQPKLHLPWRVQRWRAVELPSDFLTHFHF